ncbi:MAG: ABC transporter ATP-binding protein/permease [Erysipelotrichaceae bacterium]|nr:ABC transporter ATP-binding protein/permease [Erysipelotrichaceae bacterium]
MLQIRNISKTYQTGSLIQTALDHVSFNLRDSEFVAVLGPSGSGKTTLLNIIGGLDRYDEGDLIINGISTKDYKDRDWDTYRNHAVGFVFQSYNLIPHQTILSNVELALTIAGIGRKERRERALIALDEVGLKDQAHKRPNQLSGGQMQRVAIARALVNDPDILLADEPTGALDSKTSLQVMELLKEVAKDRLVVMVTHNPELAQRYASRIINLKDGQIVSDSDPCEDPKRIVQKRSRPSRKAHMSYLTALSLSFNNLLTKKGRTILTAFAGSIGIIGIALILALSTGFQNYINDIQEDTMSSYPLTIQSETSNVFGALISSRIEAGGDIEDGLVREQMMITSMMNSIGSNDLKSFKHWLENSKDLYGDDLTHIGYTYSVAPRIYTKDVTGAIVQLNPNTLMSSIYSDSAASLLTSISSSSAMGVFSEYDFDTLPDNCELLKGEWPDSYDEVLLVLPDKGRIADLMVYSLGLRDNSELKTLISDVMSGNESKIKNEPMTLTYDDLLNVELKLVDVSDLYRYNEKYGTYEDMSDNRIYMNRIFDSSETLKITGVAYVTGDNSSMAGVLYCHELIEHVIDKASSSKIVARQLADRDIDVFSGNSFDEENKKQDLDFNDMISIDEDMLKNAFKINVNPDDFTFDMLSEEQMQAIVMNSANTAAQAIVNGPDRTTLISLFTLLNSSILNNSITAYEALPEVIREETVDDSTVKYLLLQDDKLELIRQGITGENYKTALNNILNNLPDGMSVPPEIAGMLRMMLTDEDYAGLADDVTKMYDVYFNALRSAPGFNPEDASILYDDSDPDNIRYGTASIGRGLLIAAAISDESALSNTSAIVNRIMNDYVVAMIAGQIGLATAEMLKPMTESFSSLSDLFNGDLMTVDTDAFAKAFRFNLDEEELSRLMSSMMTSSSASYSNNLINLGYQDLDDPTTISLYFRDFDAKEHFLSLLKEYNDNAVDDDHKIKYTDFTGILMSSVQTIINAVTYVLIAFVSISLVVSSIMIAVITLISVMERTKEIGILRAIGASKHNISSIFTAETFIIGLLSGVIGVGVSWLLIIPINKIIHSLTDIDKINAVLELPAAIVLIVIAVLLTIFAGFIPSKKASRQDPVVALRTE